MTTTPEQANSDVILQVRNLSTHFFTKEGEVKAVDDVSFRVEKGETLAIVGESGSGKTVTALSMLKLISPPGKILKGQVLLEGKDLLQMKSQEIRKIRGSGMAMILQEPMSSLNPAMTTRSAISATIPRS